MSKQHTPTAIHWSNEAREKMIDKSGFYPGDERIYQYGYYDGFHEAIYRHRQAVKNHDRLAEALERIVDAQFNPDKSLNALNVEVKNAQKLLTELKQQ